MHQNNVSFGGYFTKIPIYNMKLSTVYNFGLLNMKVNFTQYLKIPKSTTNPEIRKYTRSTPIGPRFQT